LVGAFCNFGVSDTGSAVQNYVIFWVLRRFREIRGWYNIISRFWGYAGGDGFIGFGGLLDVYTSWNEVLAICKRVCHRPYLKAIGAFKL